MTDKKFDTYYAPDEQGQSVYSRRFGEYAVPANEISLITSLVAQVLREDYDCLMPLTRREDSVAALQNFIREEQATRPDEIYQFLVQQRLGGMQLGREKDITLHIADFGCGDGRHLPFYVALAKELKPLGISLQFDCYDISSTALATFKQKAVSQYGFSGEEAGAVGDNISLHFIEGSAEKLPHTTTYDLSLCLFGVISYAENKVERAKIIKGLFDATTNAVLFSVPTAMIAQDQQLNVSALKDNRITYQAAGESFDYSIFPEMKDFPRELVEATAKKRSGGMMLGSFQLALTGEVTRPTHASQSMRAYIKEMADGRSSENIGKYIYQPHIMRPNAQRAQDFSLV